MKLNRSLATSAASGVEPGGGVEVLLDRVGRGVVASKCQQRAVSEPGEALGHHDGDTTATRSETSWITSGLGRSATDVVRAAP